MATMLTIDGESESFDAPAAMPPPGAPRHPQNDRFEYRAGKMLRVADAHIARSALNLTRSSPLRNVWNRGQRLGQRCGIEQAGIGPRASQGK
jgi:hypothetical protein